MNVTGSDVNTNQLAESSIELNDRYASALLPLTVTFGFLLALGILGNLLTLLVFLFSKDYRRNTFKVFVIALALIDLSTCATLFPTEIMTHRYYFLFKTPGLCKGKCFVTVFGASASCLALLVISVDRFRRVMQPLRRQLTPSLTMAFLFVVVCILPILLAIPATIMCGIHHTSKVNIHGGQTEVFFCETEERYKNSKWRTIYKLVLIILQLVISVIYVILYAFVMKEAYKHIRAIRTRESLSSTLAQTKTSSEDDGKDELRIKSTLNENGQVVSNILKGMIRNSTASKDELTQVSQVCEPDNSSERMLMQKGTIRDSPSPKVVKVKKSKSLLSKRSQISVSSQRTEFPTKTLVWFVLTLIFIVTNAAHLGLTLKRPDIVHMSTKELFWFLVFFRVYFINHVINPVVYAIFLKSFRTSCVAIFSTIKEGMKFQCAS